MSGITRGLQVLIVVLAVASVYLWYTTVANMERYVEATRVIEVRPTLLCPVGDDAYRINVRIDNQSPYRLYVESHIFEVWYEERLVAGTVFVKDIFVPSGEGHEQELIFESELARANRPALTECGITGGWRVAGRIEGRLPVSRQRLILRTERGGE